MEELEPPLKADERKRKWETSEIITAGGREEKHETGARIMEQADT